jgi:hypothetical protein
MPGQSIEDIARAEAVFLEKVIALHPDADGKPCVIGNCQAGWAVMMLAAMRRGARLTRLQAAKSSGLWRSCSGQDKPLGSSTCVIRAIPGVALLVAALTDEAMPRHSTHDDRENQKENQV